MAMAGLWDILKSLTGAPQTSGGQHHGGPRQPRLDDHVANQIGDNDPGLALAVVKSGRVVHEAGYGMADDRAAITPDTIFHMASCGKQLTGIGIMLLAEAGKVGLDDPVGKHLRELSGFGPKVTLRHLLHHTSGIRDLYDDYGMEQVLARCARPSNADAVRTYAELKCPMSSFGCEAGDTYAYSNSGYDLLGSVIERVSGGTYRDFFQQRVFDPLGMKDTFTFPDRRLNDPRIASGYTTDDGGYYVECGGSEYDDLVGSGSFYTTVRDLCIYDRALAANALVSPAHMQEALTSGRTNDGKTTGYGFGWYIGVHEGMRYADHDGDWIGYYSYICRYLDQPLSIFVLSNHPEINLTEVANVATEICR
jgi:CubicO group peptidase (beta-lactamase class C family)